MKTIIIRVAASLLATIVATPTYASCDQELSALDARVKDDATKAVATSSSGQGVAAKRDQQAMRARDSKTEAKDQPGGPAAGTSESHAVNAATEAGGAGDRVMQAKVAINDARVAKGKGDEGGCLAAVEKAKGLLER